MIIRYWDIKREDINNKEKKSFIVNAPNNLTHCNFTKSNFDKTNILQSNEAFNEAGQRINMAGFSQFLNYNGVFLLQNDVDDNNIRFCSRIAYCSDKSIITIIIPMSLDEKSNTNILVSSSWDGKIKIWK